MIFNLLKVALFYLACAFAPLLGGSFLDGKRYESPGNMLSVWDGPQTRIQGSAFVADSVFTQPLRNGSVRIVSLQREQIGTSAVTADGSFSITLEKSTDPKFYADIIISDEGRDLWQRRILVERSRILDLKEIFISRVSE